MLPSFCTSAAVVAAYIEGFMIYTVGLGLLFTGLQGIVVPFTVRYQIQYMAQLSF